MGPCESCVCRAGEIRCAKKNCPDTTKCKPNEKLEVPEGECCAKCVEIPAVCTVFVPHYKTFDGKFFSFQQACKYQLAADCVNHTFSIRITNDVQQKKLSGRAKTITFKTANIKINLGQKLRVKVNGTRVSLPHEESKIARIYENWDGIVVVETELGIKLTWDGYNFLQLEAPVAFKGKLCGLCGNYNNIWSDDLKARTGNNMSENEVRKFADSWRVGGYKACSRRPNDYPQKPHHCVTNKKKIAEKCRELKAQEYFGNCTSRVNSNKYFEFCKSDMCECSNQQCYCESFTAYAYECIRNGINLPKWRRNTSCELNELNHKERESKKNRHGYSNVSGVSKGNNKRQRHHQDNPHKIPELLHRQNIPKVLISNYRTPPPLHWRMFLSSSITPACMQVECATESSKSRECQDLPDD